MKKSKIIIPALGVILLTTAASVSGTVAWFLASKDVKVSATNFKVNNIDGNLSVTAAAVAGTKLLTPLPDGISAAITVADNTELTDGSYDHGTHHATRLIKSSWNQPTTGKASYKDLGEAGDGWKVSQSNDTPAISYYAAVAFKYTFSYEFSTNDDEVLYFDWANSLLNVDTEGANGTGNANNAFRIFMYTDDKQILFSNHLTTATPTYVPVDHESTAGAAYGDDVEVFSANATSKTDVKSILDKGEVTEAQQKLELGTLTATENELVVNCVAWFEGSDLTNIINDTKLATMSAELAFVARTKA